MTRLCIDLDVIILEKIRGCGAVGEAVRHVGDITAIRLRNMDGIV